MSTVIGQTYQYPVRVPKKESVIMTARFFIASDASVVTASNTVSDSGITIVKNGTGNYDVTFPICPSDVVASLTPCYTTFPAAGGNVRITNFVPTSGTLSITTSTAVGGVAADTTTTAFNFSLWIMGAVRTGN